MTEKKKKPMSRKLKSFLKKYGKFPKGDELKNYQKRSSSPKKKKGKKKPKHHKSKSQRSHTQRRGLIWG